MTKRAAFIGRFQPFHKGHEWLIRSKLDNGVPCLVMIRDIEPDEKNPFTCQEAKAMIEAAFENEEVSVMIIPDVESVNWGRGVGYETNEMKPPEDIKRISATQIRESLRSGDNSWKDSLNPKVAKWLESYYNKPSGQVLWFTGLSGAGKTTLCEALVPRLESVGHKVVLLDGDQIRKILPNTGFSKEARDEHVKRVGYLASVLSAAGITVLCSLISPYEEARTTACNMSDNSKVIFVDAPLSVCQVRDPKGLYKKVAAGEIKNFTGIDDPYEAPSNADIVLKTSIDTLEECLDKILKAIK